MDRADRMKEGEVNSQRTHMHCIAHEHKQQCGEGQREGRAGSGWKGAERGAAKREHL